MTETLHHPPDCYSRAELCRTFGLSRSGLYDHALKAQGCRCLQDKVLAKQIKSIFEQSRRTYGARRLQQMLRRQGTRCGRTRLGRLMRQLGLQPLQNVGVVQGRPKVHIVSRLLLIALTSYLFSLVCPTKSGVLI